MVVKYLVVNGISIWYSEYVEKYHNLSLIQNVVIDEFKQDEMNIPKHAFILYMVVRERLATQDKIKSWGSFDMMVCFLYLHGDEYILFRGEKRSIDELYEVFVETIRLRLSSLKANLNKAVTKA
ncbi:hypothetical protein Tco_1036939 [Tanacetum coccineum]